ncbi:hypothetical protein D3C72_1715910 [compost metagenome]
MRRGAGAEGGKRQLARVLLGIGHHVLRAVEGLLGAGQQHQGADAHHADTREAVRIVRQVLVQIAVRDECGVGGHQDGVAVRLLARHIGRANGRAGARLVFHDHGLAQGLGHAFSQDAGQHIGGATGREGRDDLDGSGRIGLGLRAQRGRA